MNIMEIMNLVAEATQVPVNDLTLVGTRRYGPDAPVRFVEDKSQVTGTSDVDVVIPWDGDMMEMRRRLEAAFPVVEDHPNRGLVPYEGPEGWTPHDLNLVVVHECLTINMIVKNKASCASWRAATDELDRLALKPVFKDGIEVSNARTALWSEKPTRVAAFKAARNAYLHGYAKAQSEASASYWALHARAIAAENAAAGLEADLAGERRSLAALMAKANKDAYEARQRQLSLEAQLQLRGWLLIAACIQLLGLVVYLHLG